jgi:nicotinamide riboside kinase
MFCDTDALTTCVWSDTLFGHTPDWVRELAGRRRYDLYLVTDVDVPWVSDGQRFFSDPAQRRAQFDRFLAELKSAGRPHEIIRGTWDQRFAAACAAVERLIGRPS